MLGHLSEGCLGQAFSGFPRVLPACESRSSGSAGPTAAEQGQVGLQQLMSSDPTATQPDLQQHTELMTGPCSDGLKPCVGHRERLSETQSD